MSEHPSSAPNPQGSRVPRRNLLSGRVQSPLGHNFPTIQPRACSTPRPSVGAQKPAGRRKFGGKGCPMDGVRTHRSGRSSRKTRAPRAGEVGAAGMRWHSPGPIPAPAGPQLGREALPQTRGAAVRPRGGGGREAGPAAALRRGAGREEGARGRRGRRARRSWTPLRAAHRLPAPPPAAGREESGLRSRSANILRSPHPGPSALWAPLPAPPPWPLYPQLSPGGRGLLGLKEW